jgi:hypothetical protein
MTTPIPAVCTNKKCRRPFLVTNAFGIPSGGSTQIINCTVGPCPHCGGNGLIPSGTYSNVLSTVMFTPRSGADKRFLERALKLVREAVDTDMTPEAFQQAAQERSPELSALWSLMPKNQQDLYQFWMLVIAAIGAILLAYQTFRKSDPVQMAIPKEFVDAIQSSRPSGRDDSRRGQRRQAKAKKDQRRRRS